MQRRQFLAVLGGTAVAGCTGETVSTDGQSSPEETTTVSTTEPPETETTTSTTEAPPREYTESTPSKGAGDLERGRTYLEAAISAFTGVVEEPGSTIADVTPATTDFSRIKVYEEIKLARRHLGRAKEFGSAAVAAEAGKLLEVADFLDTLGFAQIHLVNSYGALNQALQSIYLEKYDSISDGLREMERQQTKAGEYARSIRETYDESTFDSVGSITGEHFNLKLDRIDEERATFAGLATHLDGLEEPFEQFADQVYLYRTKQYDSVDFYSSRSDFEVVREGLSSIEPAASLTPIMADNTCLFDALVEGTKEMQEAVRARRNSEYQAAKVHERDAETDYETCDLLVEEVKPVSDLLDVIPQ